MTRNRNRHRAAAVLAASALIGLAACDGNWTIDYVSYENYSTSEATVAVLYKPMPLVVLGNPTTVSEDDLTAAMAEALKGSHIVHDTVFKPAARRELHPYRTVIAFGTIGQSDICTTAPGSVAAGPATMMNAAFCRGKDALSFLQSRIAKVDDPAASSFRKHVHAVGLQLFPKENPNVDR